MRLVTGIGLVVQAAVALRGAVPLGPAILYLLTGIMGLLLLAGLYTPIVGAILTVVALDYAFLHLVNPWTCILLGTLGAALALLGPGAWSVDARLFGRREIDLPERKR